VSPVTVDRLQRQRVANDRRPYLDAVAGRHVDERVLQQRAEYENEAGDHPDVDRLDVGDSRQRLIDAGALRGGRQHAEQADGDASRRRLDVDPERHPGQDDDEDRRDEDLDQEEADLATQNEANLLARKGSCGAHPVTQQRLQNAMSTSAKC